MPSAKLNLDGGELDLPAVVGSEGEVGLEIARLRGQTGAITLDPGYANTGSCTSSITFIDGEKGILRYRGYPIEQLAGRASFLEVCQLLIYGSLPGRRELEQFGSVLGRRATLHEDLVAMLGTFPPTSHPMAVLASAVASMSAFYPSTDDDLNIMRLLAKAKTIAAFAYKNSLGQAHVYPRTDLGFCDDFLHMMFASPGVVYEVPPVLAETLDMLLVLHADHEQNCSTSTVRMVGSSEANLFASASAGISALWGVRHGGANQAVIQMLERIRDDGGDTQKYVEMAKDKDSGFRLMGFGHRVYKNFDPRALLLREAAGRVFGELGVRDPLLTIARDLEAHALEDEYFVERKLYPNVDFYSGILYRAMGIPTDMFTVMFALGRMPGWIAQWLEMRNDPATRINRPRQIYTGPTARDFVPLDERA